MTLTLADWRLTLRTRLLTLSVCTTGSTSLAAAGSTYTRAAGSFIADGFRAGMEVTPAGFTDTTKRMVTKVEALTLTLGSAPTAEVASVGRTLTVGVPQTRSYENIETTPASGVTYLVERFLPGPLGQDTIGPLGWLDWTGIYQVEVHVPWKAGPDALDRYGDEITKLFTPRTSMSATDGAVVRVRTDGSMTRSPILESPSTGFRMVAVSVPVWVLTPNTI